ncbi:MAG: hypothetical protein U0470_02030 [Anaerolineae bacterium]
MRRRIDVLSPGGRGRDARAKGDGRADDQARRDGGADGDTDARERPAAAAAGRRPSDPAVGAR